MKKLFLVFVLVGSVCHFINAQTGHYFLSHYKPGNDNISYQSYDIQQDSQGILYFADAVSNRIFQMLPDGTIRVAPPGPRLGPLPVRQRAGFRQTTVAQANAANLPNQ